MKTVINTMLGIIIKVRGGEPTFTFRVKPEAP